MGSSGSRRFVGNGGSSMKVRIELSQEDVIEAAEAWLESKGYKVSLLVLNITDGEGSSRNGFDVSARAEVTK